MKYIDLTHNLNNNINVYPGDPKFKIITKTNEDCNLSEVSGGLHNGTHIDSQKHYVPTGEKVNNINLNKLIGQATILNTKKSKEILIKNTNYKNALESIVIIKTNWYKKWGAEEYYYENPYLSIELAKLLIKNNVNGIAIDTCSVDKYGENKIHKLLLKNNIWIVENITNTEKLIKNKYKSYFIPMNITAEASYVRAFVKEE